MLYDISDNYHLSFIIIITGHQHSMEIIGFLISKSKYEICFFPNPKYRFNMWIMWGQQQTKKCLPEKKNTNKKQVDL